MSPEEAGDGKMEFHEQGLWRPEGGERDIRFHNVYRWTRAGGLLGLEHLRFGADNPVFLFELAQVGEGEWRPASQTSTVPLPSAVPTRLGPAAGDER